VLTLNGPGACNALSTELAATLHAALTAAEVGEEVRVPVLTGWTPRSALASTSSWFVILHAIWGQPGLPIAGRRVL
jgi:hypothetical protein